MCKGGCDKARPAEVPPKTCFKGVETFLRRVAFNLGYTPSQTEVKIISCIPIDVTDLQQKIVQLEKQLEEARRNPAHTDKECCRVMAPPCRIMVPPCRIMAQPTVTPPRQCSTPSDSYALNPGPSPKPDPCPTRKAASARREPSPCTPTTSATPTIPTTPTCPEYCRYKQSALSVRTSSPKSSKCSRHRDLQSSSVNCRSDEPRKKNIFKRCRKSRNSSPIVYYAETKSSPFTNYGKEVAARREMKRMDELYVGDLLAKQYEPGPCLERWAGASSQVSAPVCRDAPAPPPGCARADDACSCCRGHYYDLDLDPRPNHFLDDSLSTYMHRNVDSGNIYYNAVYYDIFPVKEKLDKETTETDAVQKWEQTFQLNDNCLRKKYKSNIESRPVLMNTKLTYAPRCANKIPGKFGKCKNGVPNRVSTNESTEYVDSGELNMKRVPKKRRGKVANYNNKSVLLKDVECLTLNVNDTECQTESSKNMRPEETETIEENHTEMTLNQIKSILQSVLSHVKTNNQLKGQTSSKEKRDAIVQKELQPDSSPVCSRFLNSYTYSPYSMGPYAPAACPVVLPPHPAVPSTNFKCMENFPVLVQHTPLPRQCSGCCHPRPELNSHLIQTATNTSMPAEAKRSKETEHLIKEIYESMALNISRNTNAQTPSSVCNDSGPRNVFEGGDPVISNMMTLSRQVGPGAGSHKARSEASTSSATSSTSSAPSDAGERRSVLGSGPLESAATPASERRARSDGTESEDIESDSDHTAVLTEPTCAKDNKQPGIFKRMFSSVFKRRRKAKRSDRSSVASDSDDYQTVYSQSVERPRRVTYAAAPAYMEQENRRQWNEELTFQRPQTKDTSEQTPSRPRSTRPRPPGIYFHKCEARPTATNQTSPFQPDTNSDTDPPRPPRPRKSASLKIPNKMSWPKKQCQMKCAQQWTRLKMER